MKESKVLLCKDCEGYGKIDKTTCPNCKGSGKVIKTTETKPYKKDNNDK